MGGGDKKQTVGYRYYLGLHMILCHGPIDAIKKLVVDGKDAWSGSQGDGSITFSAENLFGGEDREGGVSGTIDVQLGAVTQMPNDYLVEKLGPMVPGYRGVVGAILRQCYVGMNPYIKRWAFRAQRIHVRQNGIAQWYDAKAQIGNDMNPAHIIRECLTDPEWGMGYPEAEMDDPSFTAAADTLYTESMGMSLLWDKSKDISDFIQDVLAHIQGSLYVSRSTGKFVLKLTRADYIVGDLTVLDEDSITKISDFKRSTVGELVNSVTVVYWDALTGNDGSITVQDIALIAQQQAVISTTKQYPGFTTGANATRAASTELRSLSTPMASGIIYTNRKAATLNVGDCFVLSWPRYGVSQMVCRVTNVELGSIDSNQIKISMVEDVFAQSSSVYSAPPASGWVDPNSEPAPCPYHTLIEAPYWELVQRLGETAARDLASTSTYFVISGVRPSSDALNAKLYSDPYLTGYTEYGSVEFCPSAVVTDAITLISTVWPLSQGVDLNMVVVGSYAMVDDEIVSVVAISTSSVTVGRGCLDTVPASHAASSRIYFPDVVYSSDNVEYATGETCNIKLLPTTGKGVLAIGSAVSQQKTAVGRHNKPYPPGNLKFNNVAYPSSIRGDVDLVISWAHRDRLQQTATLLPTTYGSVGPELNTQYTVEFYDSTNTLVSAVPSLTGITVTHMLAAFGGRFGLMYFRIKSIRDGISSYQYHNVSFYRAGYGAAYGIAYGGV